jgi:6-phosphofructokinase 2
MITLTMNPALDKSAIVQRIEPNKKLRSQAPSYSPGGGGVNVARAVHILGHNAKAVYPGGGPTGDTIEQFLEKEGIFQYRIKVESWMRENLTVQEEVTGNQYRFGMPGAPLKKDEWQKCLDIILKESRNEDFLVASGSLPPGVPDDFYKTLAQKVRGYDVKLIVDTSGKPLRELRGAGLFLLKPNLRELRHLTGRELKHEDEQEEAAQELINEGTCEILLLSLGAAGALLVTADQQQLFHSPTVKVESRIGAGDSTVAGMVSGFIRGMELREAVMFGIAAGAAAVMTPGTELCRRNDTESIFQRLRSSK